MKPGELFANLPSLLKHRITIERRIEAADGAGGVEFQWEELVTVWAAAEEISARERLLQERVAQEATHRFYIRFRGDVEHDGRIIHDGRAFDILTVTDLEQSRVVLEIVAAVEN